ncbi:hypothetical protein HYV57_02075 [Candidatus Peregrinibacteria bacterium]|nr:hypothetical protein [Candidatus Peregrinibacteria bacterium]
MIHAQKLHNEFVRLGGLRLNLKNKMLAMLPKIHESGIWKKYADSIEEYAGKYGDIAKTTVIKRLRLEENLKDKPCLKAAIEKAGVHKVAMLAKIATPETDSRMAENIVSMSKMAVQSLSKEFRSGQVEKNGNQQFHFSNFGFADQGQSQPCRAVFMTKKIELDENATFLFLKLKSKLGKNLSDKEFLKLILEERSVTGDTLNRQIKQSDEKDCFLAADNVRVADNVRAADNVKAANNVKAAGTIKAKEIASRYIPVSKKREVVAQTNGKCIYPNCHSPYEVLHHVYRYSESKTNDSIIPFCKIHHEFAHHNLIRNETLKTDAWRISLRKDPVAEISQADFLYRKYKQKIVV